MAKRRRDSLKGFKQNWYGLPYRVKRGRKAHTGLVKQLRVTSLLSCKPSSAKKGVRGKNHLTCSFEGKRYNIHRIFCPGGGWCNLYAKVR